MLPKYKTTTYFQSGTASIKQAQIWKERVVMARFIARINAFGPLSHASRVLQARILEEVKIVARGINVVGETGLAAGYDRHVLYEDPARWSLAAIIMRPGQKTETHDHGGWGCAVTVQGVERDRRFVHDEAGNLVLTGEHNYPVGAGYVFDPVDVHQPVAADPHRVTVALHFLVHESAHHNSHPEVIDFPGMWVANAA
jgi:hypothetical protein